MELLSVYLFKSLAPEEWAKVRSGGDLRQYVESNFDLLGEKVLRGLIAEAIQNQEEIKTHKSSSTAAELLGSWGVVIDTVRDVTGERQQRAGQHFQNIMKIAAGGEPKVVAAALTKLYREQQVDRLFMNLLDSTLEECRKAGHTEYVGMLGFFKEVLSKVQAVAEALAARKADQTTAKAPLPVLAAPPKKESTTAFPPPVSRVEEFGSEDDDSDDEEGDEEDDDDDEVEVPVMDSCDTAIPSTSDVAHSQDLLMQSLMQAGEYLSYLLETYKGDAPSLRDRAQSDLCSPNKLPFGPAHLRRVVNDHLQAAAQAGYVNRVQFMKFMLDRVLCPVEEELQARGAGGEASLVEKKQESEYRDRQDTTHHAPKFFDAQRIVGSADASALQVSAPSAFIESSSLSKLDKTKGKGTKSLKKELRRATTGVAKRVGIHLQEHGWAVCDHFLSLDLVRRVRIEAGLFAEHYEQSEVWVGARADVGTLLSVPSVRGDKVIWMCGGHKSGAPEGMTRVVKTAGEIEPCRLEAKARAPMRKFSALKELVAACDRLMDELKLVVPDVSGVYDRSDAMLANYPGQGSRFARHIDNTTQDGRRVTMLVYLNPGWSVDMGGALRLTPTAPDTPAVDILPDCGRLALFYSATMPHEVMPTWGDRHAITIWYYDSAERKEAQKRAKEGGRSAEVAKAGANVQREAKLFIADLMGGDEVDSEGGDPSAEELSALANKVQDLSPEALGIVASITGAPSAQSFKDGFRILAPEDLKQIRNLFRRMGL